MGRPTVVPEFASITYYDNGLVKQITHSNGVTFTQTPDASGMARPGSMGTNRDWPIERYQYDAAGSIRKIGGKEYSYDLSSRLTSVTIPGVSLPFRGCKYDAFGNLTEVAQGASASNITIYVSYAPNLATNQLQSAGYDPSGRLFSYQGSTYSWDVLNNITKVNTGNEEWVHTYDAARERVWSWRTSSTRKDTYALRGLDGKVLTDFTKEGTTYTWEDYIYREGQLLAASTWDGITTHVAHFDVDHLGSVRQETDDNGAVIKYREFWPYGEEATPPSGTEQMKFTGHERDLGVPTSTADDIDYMHARYYKPLFARFLSPDSVGGQPSAPQSWNRYSYALGNPLKYIDPWGLTDCSPTHPSGSNGSSELACGDTILVRETAVENDSITLIALDLERRQMPQFGRFMTRVFDIEMGLLLPTLFAGEAPLIGLGLDTERAAATAEAGAAAAAQGLSREQQVAELVQGTVSRQSVKTPFGSTDIDVLGPSGELISVGGPAKALNLAKFGSHLKVLKTAAQARGVPARMFLAKGTPQKAIDLAIRHLGVENVVIFP